MRSQDYRYDVIKAIFPGWAYQLVHLFAVGMFSRG
jgi:steroid 5-alpha reductase family enzyme